MNSDLREKIINYNRTVAAQAEQAEDLKVLLSYIFKLAPGQIKKLFSNKEVIQILEKYGFTQE